jgi:hypothetical protein
VRRDPQNTDRMKALSKLALALTTAAALSVTVLLAAEEKKDNPTKEFMAKYHKAPRGTDPVAKRATMGKATMEELKALAEGYHAMAKAKPPEGDLASWKEKTTKAATAADALVKGEPDASERYKQAANCKACHDAHKPKQQP